MSREIKFRIWDDTPIKDGFKGIMISHEYAIKSSYLIDALSGKYPLMQFTGLKDKNGIEIYEGDILENTFTIKNYDDDDYHLENRYSSQYETKTSKSVVKFIKGEFRITSGASFNSCKIIGNIHENPELLTQHKN